MLLTVGGWIAILFIFGYADFIATFVAIGVYIGYKKNKVPKRKYCDFLFRGILPLLVIQSISILIFYITNHS
jgi:hypothetical protein